MQYLTWDNIITCWKRWVELKRLRAGRRRKGSTQVKYGKENMMLVDKVAVVVKVYIAVCLLCLRRWNTTLSNLTLCGHKAYIETYYCTLQTMQEDMILTSRGNSWLSITCVSFSYLRIYDGFSYHALLWRSPKHVGVNIDQPTGTP